MSIYDKASLVLIPSGTKTSKVYSQKPVNGDGDFTFSRSTAATRVNADGNIEKGRENVLRYSNQPNTHTINLSTYSGSQSDPFGGNTAWAWRETATTGQHYGITNNNQVLGVGVWTFSVYVKPVNKTSVYFTWNSPNASNYGNVDFNFTSKTFTKSNVIEAGYEELSNGWFRLYYAINVSVAGAHNVYYNALNTYTGNASNGYDFTRFQIERGLVATDYIETDASPVEAGITDNVPRLDYTDSSCPALLLEPQRTNLLTNSEYLNDWFKTAVSVNSNVATSPEGLQNAGEFVVTTQQTAQGLATGFTADGTSDYVVSGYISKNSTADLVALKIRDYLGAGTTHCFVQFSPSTGVVQASIGEYAIESFNDDWWYVWSKPTTTIPSGARNAIIRIDNQSVGTNCIAYGIQVEAGSYATSYIPTYGTSVTRNADTGLINAATDLIGQTEGTLFLDVEFDGDESVSYPSFINVDTNASNRFGILRNPNDKIHIYMITGGVSQFTTDTTQTSGRVKIALAYANNDVAVYVNGTSLFTSSSVSIPATNTIALNRFGYNTTLNTKSRIGNTMLFKTRLSNEELADLTTL